MKHSPPSDFFRPFENLKSLLKQRADTDAASAGEKPQKHSDAAVKPADDCQLFVRAMADVKPLSGKKRVTKRNLSARPLPPPENADSEVLACLDNLVKFGQGFVVSDTPEYMEGRRAEVHPEITKRLHQGNYAIQGHIDLHGLGAKDALLELDHFFRQAVQTGKQAVLIVHGRGLSSPKKPVLKAKVYEWLTRGPWRKWVIAFASAQLQDGGAGATYVLLRQRPQTRRFRKKPHA
jgi:DNA-nicking Smr family endonuclease